MIGVARSTLLALVACVTWLAPLAAQAPALIDAAPASGARIEPVAASPRHGGRAGSARGTHRRRGARAGRQRGRRRGRDRLRARGDLSARRQYRRRRLHADPPRATASSTPRSTIARPRRLRPRATIFLDERGEADPRKSRDSALAIGVPGTVAGLALAHAKYGSGKFTLAAADRAGDRARARRHSDRERRRGLAAAVAVASGALALHGEDLLRPRRPHARRRGDAASSAISPTR